jgi:hypothetical protein
MSGNSGERDRDRVNDRSLPLAGYALVGLVGLALLLGGATGDTSDSGNGIGMIVFGALLLSAGVSGLLGVLAGSAWHLGWALLGFFVPVYSLPFLLFYGLRGWEERERRERVRPR